jgi:hypothetical protein
MNVDGHPRSRPKIIGMDCVGDDMRRKGVSPRVHYIDLKISTFVGYNVELFQFELLL